jgi:hypothetical protein
MTAIPHDLPIVREHKRETAGWVADRAIDSLHSGTGFSLIRLGDGEGRLLAYPERIARQRLDKHLCYWFGRSDFSEAEVCAMQALLAHAIEAADAIGCYQGEKRSPFWREPWRYVQAIHAQKRVVGGNNLHRELWASGELDRIVQACERIVVVTCRNVIHPMQVRWSRDVLWIDVPEEAHTANKATGHWAQFGEIEREVQRLSASHVLVLVGAGALGKSYTTTAAYCDAVALDVGSLFDGWAGVESRSYLSGKLGSYAL